MYLIINDDWNAANSDREFIANQVDLIGIIVSLL